MSVDAIVNAANTSLLGGSAFWLENEVMVYIINVYENFGAFKLIVCRAEGTRYENFLHDAAQLGEECTLAFMEQFKSKRKKLNDFSMKEFHLLTTTYIDAIFQAVRHDFTRDEALHYADTLDKFFTLSWKNFFGY